MGIEKLVIPLKISRTYFRKYKKKESLEVDPETETKNVGRRG